MPDYDNKIFDINGHGTDMLINALWLAFKQGEYTCVGYSQSTQYGLILYWKKPNTKLLEHVFLPKTALISFCALDPALDAIQCTSIVTAWLEVGTFADIVKLNKWEIKADINGTTSLGWRIYKDDWGNVGNETSAICAVKKVWLWHGNK